MSGDVHSLFTTKLSGTRYRLAGVDDAVFSNSTNIQGSLDGSEDVAFGSHMGQILFARGNTKYKYDGTTVRNWGIAALTEAPTLTAIGSDSKVLTTCASTESPDYMIVNEGTATFRPDKDGIVNSALGLSPDATTGRATATKTFTNTTNFSVYDGGQIGADSDLLEEYVYVSEPQFLVKIALSVDVNDGTFQSDYYTYEFVNGESIEVTLADVKQLASNYDAEGFDRNDVASRTENRESVQSTFRIDKPVSNTGWNHFSVARGAMKRVGATTGKNWSTVKAVRITCLWNTLDATTECRFDDIKLVGGAERALTGKYSGIVVAVRDDGTYQALSGPSAISSEVEVKGQGIRFTISPTAIAALDTQVNRLWAFIMGGKLDRFYRAAVKTTPFDGIPFDYTSGFESSYFTSVSGLGGYTQPFEASYLPSAGINGPFSFNYAWEASQSYVTAGTTSTTIDVHMSDADVMIADIELERDNAVPPDDIIDIEGPHYDRTLVLTEEFIYPSRERNPDSYAAGQVVRVGSAAETALWLEILNEQVYVGTTKDIYRMDGDWTPLPDGTINVIKRPLGVSDAPVSKAVTVGTVGSSEVLIYQTASGWKILGAPLLTSDVDLLWRGFDRHDVLPVNVATGRMRCAIAKNTFFAITPEGTSTTSSQVIHAYSFKLQRWYRWTYSTNWRSIFAEPDGTLIGGDDAGFTWTLDEQVKADDGAKIPVTLWTIADANEEAFTYKEATNLQIRVNTGGDTATVAVHLNGSSIADTTKTTAQTISQVGTLSLADVSQFTEIQQRITGDFSTFDFRGYALTYRDNPLPLVVHDTNFIDLTTGGMVWVRRLRIKANSPVDLTVTPYWDGAAGTARTVSVGNYANKVYAYEVGLGRGDWGKTARVTVETSQPSQVYWIEVEFNESGKTKQKRISLVPQDDRVNA